MTDMRFDFALSGGISLIFNPFQWHHEFFEQSISVNYKFYFALLDSFFVFFARFKHFLVIRIPIHL